MTEPVLPEPALTSYYGGSSEFYEEPHWDADQMRAFYLQGVRDERERCAKLCDGINSESGGGFETFAAAIRKG